jgi:hypothetical protein
VKPEVEFIKAAGGRQDMVLKFTCPKCQATIRHPARTAGPGTKIVCHACHHDIGALGGDDLRTMQQALDGLHDALRRLGRR